MVFGRCLRRGRVDVTKADNGMVGVKNPKKGGAFFNGPILEIS